MFSLHIFSGYDDKVLLIFLVASVTMNLYKKKCYFWKGVHSIRIWDLDERFYDAGTEI
jgi:hypothetical protein